MSRIVLAYSGSLESSVAIPWMAEHYGADVVTVTMDVGQGRELEGVRERALALGAVRAHVLDVRDEFAQSFLLPALQAGAVYEGRYPLATALSRALIAKRLIEVARIEGAETIAHGCAGKGNDPVRFESAARALAPDLTVLAPVRERGLSRSEALAAARALGMPLPSAFSSPYSTDASLWGRSIDCAALEDPWQEPPEDVFQITRPPTEAPDAPAYVEVEFELGVPVRVNGVEMGLVDLIQSLETIAGTHGVGRIDMVETHLVGIKSREIHEAPAAVVLHTAHLELQNFVTPHDLQRLSAELAVTYADLVYTGAWYTPTREAIDAFVGKVQSRVTGTIRLKLFKGDCRVAGRKSAFAVQEGDGTGLDDTLVDSLT